MEGERNECIFHIIFKKNCEKVSCEAVNFRPRNKARFSILIFRIMARRCVAQGVSYLRAARGLQTASKSIHAGHLFSASRPSPVLSCLRTAWAASPNIHVDFSELARQYFLVTPPASVLNVEEENESEVGGLDDAATEKHSSCIIDQLPPHGFFRRRTPLVLSHGRSGGENTFISCEDYGHGSSAFERTSKASEVAVINSNEGATLLQCGDATRYASLDKAASCCAVQSAASGRVAFKRQSAAWKGLRSFEVMYYEFEIERTVSESSALSRIMWQVGITTAGSRFPEYQSELPVSMSEVPHRSWFLDGDGGWHISGIPLRYERFGDSKSASELWGTHSRDGIGRYGQKGDVIGVLVEFDPDGEYLVKFAIQRRSRGGPLSQVLAMPLGGFQKLSPASNKPDFSGKSIEGVLRVGGVMHDFDTATFGPKPPTSKEISVALVEASPADGCGTISNLAKGKAVFVMRGGCEFLDKVLNAQKAGASLVIVGNREHDPSSSAVDAEDDEMLIRMDDGPRKEESATVRIPSIFVSRKSARAIKQKLGSGKAQVRLRDHLYVPGHHGPHVRDVGVTPFALSSRRIHYQQG